MKRYKWILGVFFVALLLLAGCHGQKIDEGFAQNYIFSVETQNNGLMQVWLKDDDVVSYCFEDEELLKRAIWLVTYYPEGIARFEYTGIDKDDPLYVHWYQSSNSKGCGSFGGEYGSTTPVHLTNTSFARNTNPLI